jgi:hypothetical protein
VLHLHQYRFSEQAYLVSNQEHHVAELLERRLAVVALYGSRVRVRRAQAPPTDGLGPAGGLTDIERDAWTQ